MAKTRYHTWKTLSRQINIKIFSHVGICQMLTFSLKKKIHACITFSDKKNFMSKENHVKAIRVKILKYHVNHASRKIPGFSIYKFIHIILYVNLFFYTISYKEIYIYLFIHTKLYKKGSTICPTSEIVCLPVLIFTYSHVEKALFVALDLVVFCNSNYFFKNTNWGTITCTTFSNIPIGIL